MSSADRVAKTVFVQVGLAIAVLIVLLFLRQENTLGFAYFRNQDLPVAGVYLAALGLSCAWLPRVLLPERGPSRRLVIFMALFLALVLWAGTYALMYNYPLTRDEHMVVFDMQIFESGKLAEPLAAQWRPYAEALVPNFLLDVPGNALLVSAYMPGNALLRAAMDAVGDPALMNPLLLSVGLIALNDIARKLFADLPGAVWVVLAAYILSAQMLVNAMTVYAMTAHAAFNMVWLALFLRGKWWQHALAMLIGGWAIGLHQVVFHPLFAGPFILTLLAQRRWALFGTYAVVYAAGLLFWLGYPALVVSSFGITAQGGSTSGIGSFFTGRVVPLLADHGEAGLLQMELNVLRFVMWSPVFLIPFAVLASSDIRANRGLALPLFAGIVLTFLTMLILLPSQGHGWGYRYWHPVFGNFALLAGYGYKHWNKTEADRAGGAFALLGALTVLITLPMQLSAAHSFTRPYYQLKQLIGRQQTDFVIVDTQQPSSAIDAVRNLATLANRPILLSSRAMDAARIAEVCRRGTVTLITRKDFHRAQFAQDLDEASPQFDALVRPIIGQPCLRPPR